MVVREGIRTMARKQEHRYVLSRKHRSEAAKDDYFQYQEDAWVEYDLDDDWTVALRLTTTEDGMTIVSELRVFPRPRGDDSDLRPKSEKPSLGKRRSKPTREPGQWEADTEGWGVRAGVRRGLTRGVTSSLLREIRLDAAVATADDFQVEMRQRKGKHGGSGGAGWARDMALLGFKSALSDPPKRERRDGLTDLQFARLAKRYVTLVQKKSRSPILDLARSRKEDPTRIRDLIRKARQYGFLTKTKQGAKGGTLTTKSFELLKERSRK